MRTRNATERTVTTNASLLGDLIRAFIGDPYRLLIPPPEGKGYWGEPNAQGMPIIDEDTATVAFIPWEVLREIVETIRSSRFELPSRVAHDYQDRIEKRPMYAAAKALAGR